MKKVIFLNAGHSNIDPGAISRYGVERDLNVVIRDALIPKLERQGFKVMAVPDNLNLTQSIDWVNERVVDINSGLALSIHNNCCGHTGAEAYYYAHFESSRRIAKALVDEFCRETGIKNRGARSDSITRFGALSWIRRTDCWATLIECGYMDSKEDMDKIIGHFDLIAKGICKGVCKIYNIPYQEKISPSKELKNREEIKKEIIRLVKSL